MGKHRIDIRGVIIPNGYKFYFDFLGEDSTCPRDVRRILDAAAAGDQVEVYISSPGGVIQAGSEIYTMLRAASGVNDVRIYITGQAHSAASVVACAAYCEMSPTALMLVHCVSTSAEGNHADMERTAGTLREADRAMCQAYVAKSGMTEEEALAMMENETWLTAAQAVERGLVDKVMFEGGKAQPPMVAGPLFRLPTEGQMEQARRLLGKGTEAGAQEKKDAAMRRCAIARRRTRRMPE